MTTERLKYWLGIPAAVVGALLAIYGAFTFVDDIVKTPERLHQHQVASDTTHKALLATLQVLQDESRAGRREVRAVGRRVNGIVRGECIENSKRDLEKQGLIPTCDSLGVRR